MQDFNVVVVVVGSMPSGYADDQTMNPLKQLSEHFFLFVVLANGTLAKKNDLTVFYIKARCFTLFHGFADIVTGCHVVLMLCYVEAAGIAFIARIQFQMPRIGCFRNTDQSLN